MGKLKLILMDIILMIVFFGFINTVFDTKGFYFVLELLIIISLIAVSFVSMIAIYNKAKWGWKSLYYVLGIIILNMLLVYFVKGKPESFFVTILFGIIGFFISVFSIKKENNQILGINNPDEEIQTQEEEPLVKKFEPGKFVASKTGKKYHAPKCDWAKRIKKSNQIWFDSESEAKNAGYKPDSCIKEHVYKNF